ncbi:hypothetical protein GCM10017600_88840 [Streptosporangium carneum]|uniref:Uncharacterized protein n=1 Tax=Streptosporangium carneum TaxID=47481 RepID=A0A9W6ICE1_9ACTN|nr:hypothetical protein GCM10017600_88840 [Streptosporangium carneum]
MSTSGATWVWTLVDHITDQNAQETPPSRWPAISAGSGSSRATDRGMQTKPIRATAPAARGREGRKRMATRPPITVPAPRAAIAQP